MVPDAFQRWREPGAVVAVVGRTARNRAGRPCLRLEPIDAAPARLQAKSAVAPEHAATINRVPTPSKAEVDRAPDPRGIRGRAPAANRALSSADPPIEWPTGPCACCGAPKSLVRSRKAA